MSTKEEESEVTETVKITGNEILFYGDVDRENALEFVEKFKKLEIELLKKKAELWLRTPDKGSHSFRWWMYIFRYEPHERPGIFQSSRNNSGTRFVLFGGHIYAPRRFRETDG